jgi:crotonobetainyl-CoA:carnitine CoA-transferase CaiB-like acyl-CoA transferase
VTPERVGRVLAAGRLGAPPESLEIRGEDPALASRFPIGEAAACALGLGGAAASRLFELRGGEEQNVVVEVAAAAASLLGFLHQQIPGHETARIRHHTVAFYRGGDGRWIHLHGGLPHLAAGLLDLLGCEDDAEAVAAAVARYGALELEDAIAERGLCGAALRSSQEWSEHAQGLALAPLPVLTIRRIGDADPELPPRCPRPMQGLRVLDLTRILAGPACARTLAGHGADVLRIGSARLPAIEPFVIDTGSGKRNAFLDLDDAGDAAQLRNLVGECDVFCQGYREGALSRRGFGPDEVAALRPGVIYASINCYGHVGPWAARPGWEQLAQTAVGIADAEAENGLPKLVPAAAADYITGALAAYGVLAALVRRAEEGGSWLVETSLCQTGMWLTRLGARCDPAQATGLGDLRARMVDTNTEWGRLRHLGPVVDLDRTPMHWERPPSPLGTHRPEWLPR